MVRETERLEKYNIKKINVKKNYNKIEKKKKNSLKLERFRRFVYFFIYLFF